MGKIKGEKERGREGEKGEGERRREGERGRREREREGERLGWRTGLLPEDLWTIVHMLSKAHTACHLATTAGSHTHTHTNSHTSTQTHSH